MKMECGVTLRIRKINGLFVYGDPKAMVVAFGSKNVNIYAISDSMTSRGWNLNSLQNPPAIHICCTYLTVTKYGQFLDDLGKSVEEVTNDPKLHEHGSGAIYGMAASIPDKSLVEEIALGYLDVLTKA